MHPSRSRIQHGVFAVAYVLRGCCSARTSLPVWSRQYHGDFAVAVDPSKQVETERDTQELRREDFLKVFVFNDVG